MALLDRAFQNRLQRFFLALEHDGFAFKPQTFLAGNFRDRAFAGEVAAQDDEMAVFLNRIIKAVNDRLLRSDTVSRRECLGHRLAGDGQRIAVQKFSVEQHFHQRNLPDPQRGPEPSQRMSFATLVRLTAAERSAPDASTRPSRADSASHRLGACLR